MSVLYHLGKIDMFLLAWCKTMIVTVMIMLMVKTIIIRRWWCWLKKDFGDPQDRHHVPPSLHQPHIQGKKAINEIDNQKTSTPSSAWTISGPWWDHNDSDKLSDNGKDTYTNWQIMLQRYIWSTQCRSWAACQSSALSSASTRSGSWCNYKDKDKHNGNDNDKDTYTNWQIL